MKCTGMQFKRFSSFQFLCIALYVPYAVFGLENDLARTPPMGWSTYNCFGGGWNPYSVWSGAHAMKVNGMKDAGYTYCNFDGNNNGTDPYFPDKSGFVAFAKPIADSVHAYGIKSGCYTSSLGNASTTAANLASAGMDYLKVDAWGTEMGYSGWAGMRDALLGCGRDILYSIHSSSHSDASAIANIWRTSGDISATWQSCLDCMHTMANGGGAPGAWPDPDMLQVGNFLPPSDNEEQAIFSLWCVMSAPLISGCDPRSLRLFTKYLLLNTEAIAVDQDTTFVNDPASVGSGRINILSGKEIARKKIAGGAMAVVIINTGDAAADITVTWASMDMAPGIAQVRDLWEHQNLGPFTDQFTANIPSHACRFIKIMPGADALPEPPVTWTAKPAAWGPIANTPLDRTGWTISTTMTFSYSSQPVGAMLDGDVETKWFSNPTYPMPGSPGNVIIDMKAPQTFNRIILDDEKLGPISPRPYEVYVHDNTYEIYVSDDNSQWTGPVAEGSWPYRTRNFSTQINFEDQTARYIKIECKAARDECDQSKSGFTLGYDEIYVVNVSGGSTRVNYPMSVAGAQKGPSPRVLTIAGAGISRSSAVQGRIIYDLTGRRISAHQYAADPCAPFPAAQLLIAR